MKTNLKSAAAAVLCMAIAPTWALARDPAPPPPRNPPAPPQPGFHDEPHPGPAHPFLPGTGGHGADVFKPSLPMEQMKPQPFLGVVTQPVPPALSAQLGLEEGFGLLVEDVLPESPAAAAGLQKHDILKLMNDQHLLGPEQLAKLVQAAGKDADVTLTVHRKGQEQKVTARIAEQVRPVRQAFGRGGPLGFPIDPQAINEGVERLNDKMREYQGRMQDLQERSREHIDHAVEGARRFATELLPEDVLREHVRGPRVSVESSNSSSTWNTGKARVFLKDNEGEIEVNLEDGKRTMVAKDASGAVVFDGPINTEEERKAIPAPYRKKLDQVKVGEDGHSHAEGHAPAHAFPPRPSPAR